MTDRVYIYLAVPAFVYFDHSIMHLQDLDFTSRVFGLSGWNDEVHGLALERSSGTPPDILAWAFKPNIILQNLSENSTDFSFENINSTINKEMHISSRTTSIHKLLEVELRLDLVNAALLIRAISVAAKIEFEPKTATGSNDNSSTIPMQSRIFRVRSGSEIYLSSVYKLLKKRNSTVKCL